MAGEYVPLGLCPRCGYAMDGGRCAECGAAVSPRDVLPLGTSLALLRFRSRLRAVCLVLGVLSVPLVIAFCRPHIYPASDMAKRKIAEAAVGRNGDIANALRRFRGDVGRLPTTAEGLAPLYTAPAGTEDSWRGPYLEGVIEELRDPWHEEFLYAAPGVIHPDRYDLWSRGPDRKDNPAHAKCDDIGNW